MAWIVSTLKSFNLFFLIQNMWQIMCGYSIVVKIVVKTRPSCKCYMNVQRMNMYCLTIYILHSPFGEVMLNHDLQLHVECNFMYAIKAILLVNVGSNCFIMQIKVANWHFSFNE
jgi:hypothetical protein